MCFFFTYHIYLPTYPDNKLVNKMYILFNVLLFVLYCFNDIKKIYTKYTKPIMFYISLFESFLLIHKQSINQVVFPKQYFFKDMIV